MPAVALEELLAELDPFLRIRSVSADPERAADVRAAGEWVCERVRSAGGEAEIVLQNGYPLAIGRIPASRDAATAPTVLVYGHFDVQPEAPLDLWDSPPFEPTLRDEWVYARGIADDKGQLFMLLEAARRLGLAGELPVNVRVCCDGEEEIGGHSIVDWLDEHRPEADAAVIFDSSMLARGVPAFNISTRGLVYWHVEVRTGARDLHSGVYGGAALNALEALGEILRTVLPGPDGRLPGALRKGIAPPAEAELEGWRALQPGAEVLADQGARPLDPAAGEEFYVRTWAEPAVTVHGVEGGSPKLVKTVLPVHAQANLSIRLAPGQHPDEIGPELERLLREAAPEGAELTIVRQSSARSGQVPPDHPAVQLGLDAFEHVLGTRPLLVRSGGNLPIVPALADHGIPTIVTGFDVPEGNIHSPNERLLAEYLPLGVETAQELYRRLGRLRA